MRHAGNKKKNSGQIWTNVLKSIEVNVKSIEECILNKVFYTLFMHIYIFFQNQIAYGLLYNKSLKK